MAIIGIVNKQPREILPVDISYSKALGTRVATLIAPTVETPAGMTLVSTTTDLASNTVQLYISGGTAGQIYKWTVLADITVGGRVSKLEDEFSVLVEET